MTISDKVGLIAAIVSCLAVSAVLVISFILLYTDQGEK